MEKEFIPYEQALALKDLGFDEPCFGSYQLIENRDYENGLKISHIMGLNTLNGIRNHNYRDEITNAPTFSQAFRWFRDKYGYLSYIDMDNNSFYRYTIYKGKGISEAPLETYEEAELACLDKLIEIVKFKLE